MEEYSLQVRMNFTSGHGLPVCRRQESTVRTQPLFLTTQPPQISEPTNLEWLQTAFDYVDASHITSVAQQILGGFVVAAENWSATTDDTLRVHDCTYTVMEVRPTQPAPGFCAVYVAVCRFVREWRQQSDCRANLQCEGEVIRVSATFTTANAAIKFVCWFLSFLPPTDARVNVGVACGYEQSCPRFRSNLPSFWQDMYTDWPRQ